MSVTLDRLPDDILLLILSLLDVWDVLALRQTSRYLYAVSYTPSVWLALVSRLSTLLPLPSLSLSSPTSDPLDGLPPESALQQQLERTAVNALRLSLNLTHPSGPTPTSATLIKGARHIDKLQLLGEGRWLLALTDGERLTLYDLRPPPEHARDEGSVLAEHGQARKRRTTFPRIFQQAKKVAEHTRTTGRGWHCSFEAHFEADELTVLLSWRNQTDLMQIDLSPPPPLAAQTAAAARPRPKQFSLLQTFDRVRESAPTPTALSGRLVVYPWHNGLLRVVDYRTWEEGVVVTWNKGQNGGVAEGWSREDIIALQLLPQHILVLKPTSLQFFPLPELQRVAPRFATSDSPAATPALGRAEKGNVWHLPFRVDAGVFSSPYRRGYFPAPSSTAGLRRLEREQEAESAPTGGELQPLSLLVRDVDSWTLQHFRLPLRPSPPPPSNPPYTLPPQLVAELSEIAFSHRDRHSTFSLSPSGSRALVQSPNSLQLYTAPFLSLPLHRLLHPPPSSQLSSVRSSAEGSEPDLVEILRHTPLRVMEGGNGLSICETSGTAAVGEADGDVWVFGFGFGFADVDH